MTDAPKKYTPRLEEVTLDVSALECRCHVWAVPRTRLHAGLIAFRGEYRPGSSGADDALFIRWRLRELCELRLPDRIEGLVVDFRDLGYAYGDDLSVDGNPLVDRERPIRVVVHPAQIDAFRAVVGAHRLRTDLAEASAEVADTLRDLRLG